MEISNSKGWRQESALRMMMNSIDPAVAERPGQLVASGGAGAAAAGRSELDSTLAALKQLQDDETLLIRSGGTAGVHRTSEMAPRVVIARSGSTACGLPQLSSRGVCQPAFGWSWTYIGPQGYLHTAYETLAAIGRERWPGGLQGKLVVSGGMGGMGGVLPLAAGLHGAAYLGVEADAGTITRRIREGYCDYCVNSLDEALRILKIALRQRQAVSVGLAGNCADVFPELARRGVLPDVLTDQTPADDPLNGYIPARFSPSAAAELRDSNPKNYLQKARESIAGHFKGMIDLAKMGAFAFEMGNGIQATARQYGGTGEACGIPRFELLLNPLVRAGYTPLLWVALSGRAHDLRKIDDAVAGLLPEDTPGGRWIRLARKYLRPAGLPGRTCWMSGPERAAAAERIHQMAAAGELSAPVVLAIACAMEKAEARALLDAPATAADHFPGASWLAIDEAAGAVEEAVSICVYVADGSPKAGRILERAVAATPR